MTSTVTSSPIRAVSTQHYEAGHPALATVDPHRGPDRLRFDQTVERRLVHRHAIAEVLVTDAVRPEPRRVWVAAQLPGLHAYYGEHVRSRIDPLLLIEAGRQAGIYCGELVGVRADKVSLITGYDFTVLDHGALATDGGARELVIECDLGGDLPQRRGRVVDVTQTFHLQGRAVARLQLGVVVVTSSAYSAMREIGRAGSVPHTSIQPRSAVASAVLPESVFRREALNVVLAEYVPGEGGYSALVAPRYGNSALFDHDYDHIPAAVLVEGARQLATLVLGAPALPTSIITRFTSFAELDAPVRAQSQGLVDGRMIVEFVQHSTVVTTVEFCFSTGGDSRDDIESSVAAAATGSPRGEEAR